MKIVSASDANRHFSALLREVSTGETVSIRSRGRLVATLSPAGKPDASRESARQALFERLAQTPAVGERNWSRNDLYD